MRRTRTRGYGSGGLGLHSLVPDSGIEKPPSGSRRALRRNAAILFALTFAQALIATIEVVRISQLKPLEAAVWAVFNALAYISGLIIVVEERKRPLLIPVYAVACGLATYIGTLVGKFFS